jgi:hypothetical protein
MPDVAVDVVVQELFVASRYSLDPATADFMLRRTVPITIYIDGDYDGLSDLAANLKDEVAQIMEQSGFPTVGDGSFLSTIFGGGTVPELGASLQKRLLELRDRLLGLKEKIPPEALEGIRVVLLVGTLVINVVTPGAVAALLPFSVPVMALELIAISVESEEVIEAVGKMLKLGPFKRVPDALLPGHFKI